MQPNNNILQPGHILKSPNYSYRIERVLGIGGFGITYLATASVKVGNVSVKVNFAIKEHFLSSDCERDLDTSRVVYSNPARERVESSRKDFISEANRLRKVGIEHDNIVKVNEVFEANNTAYYVMEYLDGESLRKFVKGKGRLSEDEMLLLMTPIVDAVKYLHQTRMTHLDIKPDNIMIIQNENGQVSPVLIDFGLSTHYDNDGKPTSTINVLGCSDGYAPIEQYAGITNFSPKADIYALASTMLFCLTGVDPIKSTELIHVNLQDHLTGVAPDMSFELKHTLLKALSPVPSDRPSSLSGLYSNNVGAEILKVNMPASTKISSTNNILISDHHDKTTVLDSSNSHKHHYIFISISIFVAVLIGALFFIIQFKGKNSEGEILISTVNNNTESHSDSIIGTVLNSVSNNNESENNLQKNANEKIEISVSDILKDAKRAFDKGKYGEALSLFKKISHNSTAQYYLGNLYSWGKDGMPYNSAEAARWYLKSAEQGNAEAQCSIGFMYWQGIGVPVSDSKAVYWMRKAAQQGNESCQEQLGILYMEGMSGLKVDYTEAFHWFQKAEKQGSRNAKYWLAVLYEKGLGVSQDYNEAVRLYKQCAEQNDSRARKRLEELGELE